MFLKKGEFIIECNPIRTKISDEKLKTVTEHINNGIEDGLSEQEIKLLLDWTVENTRQNIEKYTHQDITNDDLTGLCGFARSSSLLPLENIFKETYNNTIDFKFVIDDLKHAFGTITFPLKIEKEIIEKQYLIDITFRQFLKKIMCENPTYRLDGTFSMDPGYFLCNKTRKTNESLTLTQQLVKKGYIELTDENLKLYINSFIYSSIYRTNQDYLHDIKKLNIDFYRQGLKKVKKLNQEFDEEDLLKHNCITKIPYIKNKQKILR